LGGQYQDPALGIHLLQASAKMLRALVAAVFLYLAKRNALGVNILHPKELQGAMNE